MIVEYHRPNRLEDALLLLARETPVTVPLGGGAALIRSTEEDRAVVDLQDLGLDKVTVQGNVLRIGAAATLQSLLALPELSVEIKNAIKKEANFNQRQRATLGGTVVSADGRSPLLTVLIAADARMIWEPGSKEIALADWLPLRREKKPGSLITELAIPMQCQIRMETIARTPMDRPIVCAAVGVWPSGRTRVSLGGYGKSPLLAFDGLDANGAETAAREAYREAGDEWASADYRMENAGVLVERLLKAL